MILSLQGENVVCLALSRETTTRSSILTGAGDQPEPWIPQFNQSICPLGPLTDVIFTVNNNNNNNNSQNLQATDEQTVRIPVAPTEWHLPVLAGLIVSGAP